MRGREPATDEREPSSGGPAKRRRQQEPDDAEPPEAVTPSRRGGSSRQISGNGVTAEDKQEDAGEEEPKPSDEVAPTPTKRKRGRPRKNPLPESADAAPATPSKSASRKNPGTPIRARGAHGTGTPSKRAIADRSARKKSARALIEHVVGEAASDDEEAEDNLAREIYQSSESEDGEEERQEGEDSDEGQDGVAATPSKRGRGGKRKMTTRARKRSPTPPRDLPPHETYLYHNRPGRAKTSNNTLSSLELLTHEEYFSLLREYKDPHAQEVEFLQSLHAHSFPQWIFELAEGFSICLYGYGSKKSLLHQFAKEIFSKISDHEAEKIVMVNGYVRTTSMREILTTIGSVVDPGYKLPAGNPVTMVQNLSALLSSTDVTLTVILSSVDAPPLRKPGVQTVLSQLAAHPRIRLACSADTPDFALLWDSGLRSAFNFVFHDCTTFAPPGTAELEVVDDVHELLGRRARRVGGKDGVAFVLRSLPENAKSLFRLLVGEVLVLMEEEEGGAATAVGAEDPGVEYRILYNKAVEEFICSSEMAFRTLLKEFHDHQMITSRKDILGTELLSLPFRKEELEAILEDLVT